MVNCCLFLLLATLQLSTCKAFVITTRAQACPSHLFSTAADSVSMGRITSEVDIQLAAAFMVDAFWLNSPQGLVLDESVNDGTKKGLIEHQVDDLLEKYGERMGKRSLDTVLIQAVDSSTKEILGLVGLEVSLLNKDIGDTLSTTKSDNLLKNAVASLGPKDRRLYKSASVQQIATELLPPELEAVAVLSNLVVSPTARRRGIAQMLCAQVERVANDEWGYPSLYLRVEQDNAAARTLYETKLGFSEKYVLPGAMGVRIQDGSFSVIQADTLVLCKNLQ
ncbi:FR47-like protein [Fragilaria crotonensis]|nr:FR47-like protein [Fragilaria crotonensis]